MDFGDKNHILLGITPAKELIEISDKYKKIIQYVDETSIKHGEKISIWLAYGKGFGNKTRPSKLKKVLPVAKEYGRDIHESLQKRELNWILFKKLLAKKENTKLQINKIQTRVKRRRVRKRRVRRRRVRIG